MSLQVRGLRYRYPGWEPTLRGIDLDVARGRSAFLLGPSGAGKSTLLRCIAGLERTYEGTIRLDGVALDPLPPHQRGVGMLFQEPALFPHLNVWRNVAFGMRYAPQRVPRREERERALAWLALVGLAGRMDAGVDELSGGERQRVALVRTLAAGPRAVLLDEPLSALDRPLREALGARIRDLLREQRVAALWVTHDEDEAWRLGDDVWRLHEGTLARAVVRSVPVVGSAPEAHAGARQKDRGRERDRAGRQSEPEA